MIQNETPANQEGGNSQCPDCNKKSKEVDSTTEAVAHYYNGNGESVDLGPETVDALVNSEKFDEVHSKIVSGETELLDGDFSVDLTDDIFHVGRTNVNYFIRCVSGNCFVFYELFVNDGFWDPNFIAERKLGEKRGLKRYQPDGIGPRLEAPGGTPYYYKTQFIIFTFNNPGY
ncbi:MAG: hypothetical protein ED557_11935 [Balneola sp.]|nr:MAG: hypothetical protein ED557_11935 [Balneola sp.]